MSTTNSKPFKILKDYKETIARIREATERGASHVLVVVFELPCNFSFLPDQMAKVEGKALGRVGTILTAEQVEDLLAIAAKNLDKMRT